MCRGLSPTCSPIRYAIGSTWFASFVTLAASPNGGSILGAAGDGSVFLYDSNADAFTVFRKDPALGSPSGPTGASSSNLYVAGGLLLDSSLVPIRKLDTSAGTPSGFLFADQGGLMTTLTTADAAGVIQRVDLTDLVRVRPTLTVAAPLAPNPAGSSTT